MYYLCIAASFPGAWKISFSSAWEQGYFASLTELFVGGEHVHFIASMYESCPEKM